MASPAVPESLEEALSKCVQKLTTAANYRNAGTFTPSGGIIIPDQQPPHHSRSSVGKSQSYPSLKPLSMARSPTESNASPLDSPSNTSYDSPFTSPRMNSASTKSPLNSPKGVQFSSKSRTRRRNPKTLQIVVNDTSEFRNLVQQYTAKPDSLVTHQDHLVALRQDHLWDYPLPAQGGSTSKPATMNLLDLRQQSQTTGTPTPRSYFNNNSGSTNCITSGVYKPPIKDV